VGGGAITRSDGNRPEGDRVEGGGGGVGKPKAEVKFWGISGTARDWYSLAKWGGGKRKKTRIFETPEKSTDHT